MEKLTINRKPTGTLTLKRKAIVTTEAPATAAPVEVEIPADVPAPAAAPPQEYTDLVRAIRNFESKKQCAVKNMTRVIKCWPKLLNWDSPKPLAIGIVELLQADAVTREIFIGPSVIQHGIASYCNRRVYFKAFAKAETRLNLDGSAGAAITDEEREYALQCIDALKAKKAKIHELRQRKEFLEKSLNIK